MGVTRGHASRGHSVLSTHSSHNILKRRDRPYKSQKETIFGKKRKLHLQNSYERTAPPGYTFIPIGTPALAEKCKDLSRQRDYPVYVVNTEPRHISALDAQKVSAHVHREGYHFKAEVVADACDELKYQFVQGKFRSQEEVNQLYYNNAIAQAMAKRGLHWNAPAAPQETPERVRAAIKELFPRIPDHDLNAIINHSWAAGTDRVGNNPTLELPRRVQLAVIARIRHVYTDYDSLLKAMGDWIAVRKMVEPECLTKLLEWRGDNLDDDGQFEQMVRETIILDDDSDHGTISSSDDDEDTDSSADEVRPGRRNADVFISHRLAVGDDLRPEDASELQRSRIPPRPQFRSNVAAQAAPTYRLSAAERVPAKQTNLVHEEQHWQPRQLPHQSDYNGASYIPPVQTGSRAQAPLIPVSQIDAGYQRLSIQTQQPPMQPTPKYYVLPANSSSQVLDKSNLRLLPHNEAHLSIRGEQPAQHYRESYLAQTNHHLDTAAERPVPSIERADDAYHIYEDRSAHAGTHFDPSWTAAAPHPTQDYNRVSQKKNEDIPARQPLRMVPVIDVEENRHLGYIERDGAQHDADLHSKHYTAHPQQYSNRPKGPGEYRGTHLRPVGLDGAMSPPVPSARVTPHNSRPGSPTMEYDPRDPLLWLPKTTRGQHDSKHKASRYMPYPDTVAVSSVSYPTQTVPQYVSSAHVTPSYRLRPVESTGVPLHDSLHRSGQVVETAYVHPTYDNQHTPKQRIDTYGYPVSQDYSRHQQFNGVESAPYHPVEYVQKQTPKPIHGAPAAVQQLPRLYPVHGQTSITRTSAAPAPVNGAPAPTQYYVPR